MHFYDNRILTISLVKLYNPFPTDRSVGTYYVRHAARLSISQCSEVALYRMANDQWTTRAMTTESIPVNSRDVILDAAEQLVAEHGYAGLSMRELSKHSGVAKSTLYHYFQDKREIYLRVLERDLNSLVERIERAADPANGTVDERLRAVVETYLDAVVDRGIIALNALRRSGDLDKPMKGLFCEYRKTFMRPFRSVFEDGVAQGVYRQDLDVELTIMSLLGIMNSFVGHRLLSYSDDEGAPIMPPRAEMVEHTLSLFRYGVILV